MSGDGVRGYCCEFMPAAGDFSAGELALLAALGERFPSAEFALAEAAGLGAMLRLPTGAIHVISDVHGEYAKLRHVINNASGALRPLVEQLFGEQLSEAERRELLSVLYYPREAMDALADALADPVAGATWVRTTLRRQLSLVRALARDDRRQRVDALISPAHRELFAELIAEPALQRPAGYIDEMIDGLAGHGLGFSAVRSASRLVRNLSTSEIIVAGDLGDRGPRIDRVIDHLSHQPSVSVVWGNHDVSWMGACLGNEACIATVLRFSLRYRRLSQLEEGYGIPMAPLEKLARDAYGDDPAECFAVKGTGLRDDLLMARMQKAAAILQFKAEGQLITRRPEWKLEARNLLHRIDRSDWTLTVNGERHALLDRDFPTIDFADPYRLSDAEQACMNRLRQSFVTSSRLWEQMKWVVRRGRMWCARDDVLIFHACVPVDEAGKMVPLEVDGKMLSGRAQFDALEQVIRRGFARGAAPSGQHDADADWLWYLWAGPASPLFGKDKMATFESHFISDKHAAEERKNAYFERIHDNGFVRMILREFGVAETGLLVNGHVPVKIEKGELPVKRGGNAVTIDGAFSEAYGDRGYTLMLLPDRIDLAEHHHFDSVQDVLDGAKDIVPRITTLRRYAQARMVGQTEQGEAARQTIQVLNRLAEAYECGALQE